MRHLFIIPIVLFLSCKSSQQEKVDNICYSNGFTQKIETASLRDVESVKRLHGKFVQLEGVFHGYFEDVALYPSRNANSNEAIWLDLQIPETIPDSIVYKFNKKTVIVIGKVNIESKGHYNSYFATLDSTYCIKMK